MIVQHIQLAKRPDGLALQLHLGTYNYQAEHLRTMPQVGNIIKREVASIVMRYVNHRERALRQYGQLTMARICAIERIKQRFSSANWKTEYLKPKLLGIADDLILLMPHPDSRYYKNQRQLVADLIDFAHGFHATIFLQ